MTREEFEYAIKACGCFIYRGQTYYEESELIKAFEDLGLIHIGLEQEPCEKVAQERYADLCEYFGGAKDILKNKKDFKAWLERVKWHIHKAEELYEKYEYKKEPCTDAVSRQTVIDIIESWLSCDDYNEAERNIMRATESILYDLPSVNQQPCEDAVDRQWLMRKATERFYTTNYFNHITKMIEEAPSVKPQKWIPVSERLPEDNGLYLVYTEEQPFVCPFENGEFFIDEVIAWMPLPQPYKAESEE